MPRDIMNQIDVERQNLVQNGQIELAEALGKIQENASKSKQDMSALNSIVFSLTQGGNSLKDCIEDVVELFGKYKKSVVESDIQTNVLISSFGKLGNSDKDIKKLVTAFKEVKEVQSQIVDFKMAGIDSVSLLTKQVEKLKNVVKSGLKLQVKSENLPKFESGGRVNGASTTGDKILARLNAGQYVFNKKQMDVLGNMLGKGKPLSHEQVFRLAGGNPNQRIYGKGLPMFVKGGLVGTGSSSFLRLQRGFWTETDVGNQRTTKLAQLEDARQTIKSQLKGTTLTESQRKTLQYQKKMLDKLIDDYTNLNSEQIKFYDLDVSKTNSFSELQKLSKQIEEVKEKWNKLQEELGDPKSLQGINLKNLAVKSSHLAMGKTGIEKIQQDRQTKIFAMSAKVAESVNRRGTFSQKNALKSAVGELISAKDLKSMEDAYKKIEKLNDSIGQSENILDQFGKKSQRFAHSFDEIFGKNPTGLIALVASVALLGKAVKEFSDKVKESITNVTELNVAMKGVERTSETAFGDENRLTNFRNQMNLTRKEIIGLTPAIKEFAVNSNKGFSTANMLAENLRQNLGKLDVEDFKEVMNTLKDIPKAQIDVMLGMSDDSQDKLNLFSNLLQGGKIDAAIQLFEKGAFGQFEGMLKMSEGDKAILQTNQNIEKRLEDFQVFVVNTMPDIVKQGSLMVAKYGQNIVKVASILGGMTIGFTGTLMMLKNISNKMGVKGYGGGFLGKGGLKAGLLRAGIGAGAGALVGLGGMAISNWMSNKKQKELEELQKNDETKQQLQDMRKSRQKQELGFNISKNAFDALKVRRRQQEQSKKKGQEYYSNVSMIGHIASTAAGIATIGASPVASAGAVLGTEAAFQGMALGAQEIGKKIGLKQGFEAAMEEQLGKEWRKSRFAEKKDGEWDLNEKAVEEQNKSNKRMLDYQKNAKKQRTDMLKTLTHLRAIDAILNEVKSGALTKFYDTAKKAFESGISLKRQFGGSNLAFMAEQSMMFTNTLNSFSKNFRSIGQATKQLLTRDFDNDPEAVQAEGIRILDQQNEKFMSVLNDLSASIGKFSELPEMVVRQMKAQLSGSLQKFLGQNYVGSSFMNQNYLKEMSESIRKGMQETTQKYNLDRERIETTRTRMSRLVEERAKEVQGVFQGTNVVGAGGKINEANLLTELQKTQQEISGMQQKFASAYEGDAQKQANKSEIKKLINNVNESIDKRKGKVFQKEISQQIVAQQKSDVLEKLRQQMGAITGNSPAANQSRKMYKTMISEIEQLNENVNNSVAFQETLQLLQEKMVDLLVDLPKANMTSAEKLLYEQSSKKFIALRGLQMGVDLKKSTEKMKVSLDTQYLQKLQEEAKKVEKIIEMVDFNPMIKMLSDLNQVLSVSEQRVVAYGDSLQLFGQMAKNQIQIYAKRGELMSETRTSLENTIAKIKEKADSLVNKKQVNRLQEIDEAYKKRQQAKSKEQKGFFGSGDAIQKAILKKQMQGYSKQAKKHESVEKQNRKQLQVAVQKKNEAYAKRINKQRFGTSQSDEEKRWGREIEVARKWVENRKTDKETALERKQKISKELQKKKGAQDIDVKKWLKDNVNILNGITVTEKVEGKDQTTNAYDQLSNLWKEIEGFNPANADKASYAKHQQRLEKFSQLSNFYRSSYKFLKGIQKPAGVQSEKKDYDTILSGLKDVLYNDKGQLKDVKDIVAEENKQKFQDALKDPGIRKLWQKGLSGDKDAQFDFVKEMNKIYKDRFKGKEETEVVEYVKAFEKVADLSAKKARKEISGEEQEELKKTQKEMKNMQQKKSVKKFLATDEGRNFQMLYASLNSGIQQIVKEQEQRANLIMRIDNIIQKMYDSIKKSADYRLLEQQLSLAESKRQKGLRGLDVGAITKFGQESIEASNRKYDYEIKRTKQMYDQQVKLRQAAIEKSQTRVAELNQKGVLTKSQKQQKKRQQQNIEYEKKGMEIARVKAQQMFIDLQVQKKKQVAQLANKQKNAKMEIVDLAKDSIDIQLDLANEIGLPFAQILQLERQSVQVVMQKAALQEEAFQNMKKNGADAYELEKQRNNVMRANANVTKAVLGAQRSSIQKLMASTIGSFNAVAGIRGGLNKAAIYGSGYQINSSGQVVRGGGTATTGYAGRLLSLQAQGDVKRAERMNLEKKLFGAKTSVQQEQNKLQEMKKSGKYSQSEIAKQEMTVREKQNIQETVQKNLNQQKQNEQLNKKIEGYKEVLGSEKQVQQHILSWVKRISMQLQTIGIPQKGQSKTSSASQKTEEKTTSSVKNNDVEKTAVVNMEKPIMNFSVSELKQKNKVKQEEKNIEETNKNKLDELNANIKEAQENLQEIESYNHFSHGMVHARKEYNELKVHEKNEGLTDYQKDRKKRFQEYFQRRKQYQIQAKKDLENAKKEKKKFLKENTIDYKLKEKKQLLKEMQNSTLYKINLRREDGQDDFFERQDEDMTVTDVKRQLLHLQKKANNNELTEKQKKRRDQLKLYKTQIDEVLQEWDYEGIKKEVKKLQADKYGGFKEIHQSDRDRINLSAQKGKNTFGYKFGGGLSVGGKSSKWSLGGAKLNSGISWSLGGAKLDSNGVSLSDTKKKYGTNKGLNTKIPSVVSAGLEASNPFVVPSATNVTDNLVPAPQQKTQNKETTQKTGASQEDKLNVNVAVNINADKNGFKGSVKEIVKQYLETQDGKKIILSMMNKS